MTKLTKQSQNILNRLKLKSNDSSKRMPTLKSIHKLLNELKIEHKFYETSCTKQTSPSGYRYYTGGGKRTYEGHELTITDKRCQTNIFMDNTETYYSWNTFFLAKDLCKLISEL